MASQYPTELPDSEMGERSTTAIRRDTAVDQNRPFTIGESRKVETETWSEDRPLDQTALSSSVERDSGQIPHNTREVNRHFDDFVRLAGGIAILFAVLFASLAFQGVTGSLVMYGLSVILLIIGFALLKTKHTKWDS